MRGSKERPFRYTRGKLSFETTLLIMTAMWGWRAATWSYRRLKPVAYHPIALAGIGVFAAAFLTAPWLALWLAASATGMTFTWRLTYPDSYRRHVHHRFQSFAAGFYYRHRPRRKLTTCALLNDQDPTPTISWIDKKGCITRMRIKMSHGDEINLWRLHAAQIAQTYNAKSCAIDLYRRETLIPWRHDMVDKYRWLVVEFLTKDPFNSKIGSEYIDYYRDNTLEPVEAVFQNGTPDQHNLAAHRLRVAMTRWGKSVAIRAMIYAHRDNIKEGLLELWGIDGKGGVEQSFLQHCFARTAYGDSKLSPNAYNPAEFDRLLKDAVKVLKRRQRGMRGNVTEHTATPDEPWLLIVIDEILVLTSKSLDPNIRKSIAGSINLIQQQGIACGVSLDASTQFATKDILGDIERGGFTEIELGKVERGAVDMIFGTGWWDRGVRADDISEGLKGTFYKKTDSTLTPTQKRYPNITVADVSPKSLGFKVNGSKLWPPRRQHLQSVPTQPEPQPEPELEEVVESAPTPQPTPEREFETLPPGIGGFA